MKRLQTCIIAISILLLTGVSALARDVFASTAIMDAETGKRLYGSTVKVVDEATGKVLSVQQDDPPELYVNGTPQFEFHFWANDSLNLLLEINRQDYKQETKRLQYPRDFAEFELADSIWLVPADCELDAKTLINLREVTVTATKVKMVMNGDTIVYNADAFNLPEGSLLDALVSQLPGVTLSSNGQIRVNGEYISSLLVDGKDFFKGDPTVALNNLPAYIVKKIQVYRFDEMERKRELSQNERDDLPLVMDVRLKPQYQKGLIGNLSAGYGTSGRYVAKGFLMEYTRNGRIAAYGQTNNINSEAAGPASSSGADWNESVDRTGSRRITKTGLDFQWKATRLLRQDFPYESDFKISGNATYQHNRTRLITRSASDLFLPEATRYGRADNNQLGSSDKVNSAFNFALGSIPLSSKSTISGYIHSGFIFDHADNRSASRSAQFAADPEGRSINAVLDSIYGNVRSAYGTGHQVVYFDESATSDYSRNYFAYVDANLPINSDINKSHMEHVAYNLYLYWNFYNRNSYLRNSQAVTYPDEADDFELGQYRRNFSNSWQIAPSIKQSIPLPGTSILSFTEGYKHEKSHGRRRVYTLDNPFGSLEAAVRDVNNSYNSDLVTDKYFVKVAFDWHTYRNTTFSLQLDASANNDHLIYHRGDIDADVSRLRWLFEPSFTGRHRVTTATTRHDLRWNATLRPSLPEMTTLLATTDNTNPLAIYLGNPDLKTASTLNVGVSYERTPASSRFITKLSLGHDYYWNRRSTHRSYNSTTGVSTYKPVNVSGAYDLRGALDITAQIDEDNRLWLTSTTSATYEHIPDWMQENGGDDVLSTVRNTLLSENIRLNWTIRSGYSLTFGVNATWRNATSPMASFTTINAADIATKLAAQIQLPWKLQLGTDMTLYKRCGYGDASLNDASWVWNANLTRSFLSGRFLASVTAFDILGQLSNVTASINSLGRTETWTNSLHRYCMLTLTYRFSLMPHSANN
jgi:hypothetical protein